jgi:hypothetical protein
MRQIYFYVWEQPLVKISILIYTYVFLNTSAVGKLFNFTSEDRGLFLI